MTLTEPVLKAKLATIQKRLAEDGSSKRCIGVLGEGWVGPEQVRVGDEDFRVVFCASPLAVREQLASLVSDGPRLVLVTNCPEQALGADVQARVFRNRFQPVDPWQTVRDLFQATRLGPGVPQEPWLRDELVASTVEQRPSLAAGTVLDVETVKHVIFRRLGMPRGVTDLRDLLTWAQQPEAAAFGERDGRLRVQVRRWVEDTVGKAGGAVVDCVAAGYGPQALALGLVFRLIVGNGGPQDAVQREALARAERFVGNRRLSVAEIGPWADAAEDLFRQRLAPDQIKTRQPVLTAADQLAEGLGARGLAHESPFLQEGLRQREERFASELEQALQSGTSDLAQVERAADLVARHELAILERGRAIPSAVTMAVRLLRWLRQRSVPERAADFRGAALAYAREDSFVDWAREQTTLGYPHAALQHALRSLWAAVQERREQANRHFAAACAEWSKAPRGFVDLMPLEQVLPDAVRPIAEHAPVLLLVMDGMSLSVFHEIAASLPRLGWLEIGPAHEEDRGLRRYGVAAFPTVTEVSRASLLSAAIRRGNQEHERAAFESLQVLQVGSSKPRLFHKSTLSGDRLGIEPEVERVLRDRSRVVGVVLNAVDDWLGKGSEDAAPWDVERIKSLVALLDLAAQTGRVVVITSDHGHVRDHDTRFVAHADGTRWRRFGKPLTDGEVLVQGPRVCVEGEERGVVLPWTESVRYSSNRQNGYHGGISPQEVVVPLAVFAHAGREIPVPGYVEVPPGLPAWWEEVVLESPLPRRVVTPRGKGPKGPTLPFPEKQDDVLASLLVSALFQEQKKLHLRSYPGDDKVQIVLRALGERGDAMTVDALASRLDLARFRVQGLLAAMRRVLNVDGAEGLEVDPQSGTVRVNWPTLKTQFGLLETDA